MEADQDKQVTLVTGAGGGIGEAIAVLLAQRGHRVAATALNAKAARRVGDLIGGLGAQLDVTDAKSIAMVADRVEAELGLITAWVCNAGVSSMTPFLELTPAQWDHVLDVNAKGVFLCGQEAARRFVRHGIPGRIVNVASTAGKRGNISFLSDYVASKFAVVGLTQAMARELGPFGIRVNAVCPAHIRTPMRERELVWEAQLRNMSPDELNQQHLASVPIGRLGTPEDVAASVAFLLSTDAAFVSGESLAVNGGLFMD
jgi:meso-butanediol dehydrogenase/(S,S)-butanediol dehydrogenase/diacetyl reductase